MNEDLQDWSGDEQSIATEDDITFDLDIQRRNEQLRSEWNW